MNKMRSLMAFLGFLGFLFLIIVSIRLIPANQSLQKRSEGINQANQEATTNIIISTPESNSPYPAPTESSYPYPAPTKGEIATVVPTPSVSPIILPAINNFIIPGPFRTMELLYTRADKPGYYIKRFGDENELLFARWWEYSPVSGELSFQVSPDGSSILYGVWNNQQLLDPDANAIWTTGPYGSNPHQLVTATEEWFPENPIWSPDGLQIAFRKVYIAPPGLGGLVTNKMEFWVMNNDGTNQHPIFSNSQMEFGSISGKLLLFQWCINGYIFFAPLPQESALYALNPNDGKLFTLLSKTDPLDWKFSLSPDGKRALVSGELSAVTIQMTGLIPVNVEVDPTMIKWSGNGEKIAFPINDIGDQEKIKIKVKDLGLAPI